MSNRWVIFSRELLEFLGGTLVSEKCKKGTIEFTTHDFSKRKWNSCWDRRNSEIGKCGMTPWTAASSLLLTVCRSYLLNCDFCIMLVTIVACWWQYLHVSDLSGCWCKSAKSVTIITNLSSTYSVFNIRHQHLLHSTLLFAIERYHIYGLVWSLTKDCRWHYRQKTR